MVSNVRPDQRATFSSPQRWAKQQALHPRPASRSPNVRDRTPLKHSRPEIPRHRSSSRSEALLSYAEEQARQAPNPQMGLTQTPYGAPLDSLAAPFQPQHYAFPPQVIPTYSSQQNYFNTSIGQGGYPGLTAQQGVTHSAPVYTTGRPQLPTSDMVQVTAPPPNTVVSIYDQTRAQPLPSVNSLPSNFPPITRTLESTPNEAEIASSRQKPQCWDHGCNGRQFSTFSNLLRHQREKSGTATKARCPHCGTEFTRTTARNGHLYGGKCKGIPESSTDATTPSPDDP